MKNMLLLCMALLAAGCASKTETTKPQAVDSTPPPAPAESPTMTAASAPAPRTDIETVPVNKVDKPPQLLQGPAPQYTLEMIQKKIEGLVTAQVLVGKSGGVKDVIILEHLGSGTDKATQDALMQYKFEPAIKDGKPVAVWIDLSVNFRPMRK